MNGMSRYNRRGSAVVFILIAIAVVAAVWIVNYISTERLPEAENVTCSDDKFPWQEHKRIVLPGGQIDTDFHSSMVNISNGLSLTITVDGTQHHDQMALMIEPDGTVSGGWSADFNKKGEGYSMNYNIIANFEGNIDPSCSYFNADDEDYSKLFLIARGEATIIALNRRADATGIGTNKIFVSGWIDKDGKAKGQIGIILESENKIYNWHSTHKF